MGRFTLTKNPVIETDKELSINYLLFDRIAMTERKSGGADIELYCSNILVATSFVKNYASGQTLNFTLDEGKMKISFTI